MEPQTVTDLRSSGYTAPVNPQEHVVELGADGSCHFHTLPWAFEGMGNPSPLIDRACNWSLDTSGRREELVLRLHGTPPLLVTYNFTEVDGNIRLWQHISDPDAWRYLQYSKQSR
jgi:hypothetical protein